MTLRIRQAEPDDHQELLRIWERSVRTTHTFLSEEDIQFFLPLVRDHALKELELWVLESECDGLMRPRPHPKREDARMWSAPAGRSRTVAHGARIVRTKALMGFMGLSANTLEALFIAPEYFRRGGGRALVAKARQLKGPLKVDVNEQNLQAREFYEALGFVIEGRSELDSTGRPFPLLHLRDGADGS